MRVNLGDSHSWLPFAAAVFALAFALVILGDAATTMLLDGLGLPRWYAATHLTAGAVLLAGALTALLAMKGRSSGLLVLGEAFAGAALAAIVIFEETSLWALPYVD